MFKVLIIEDEEIIRKGLKYTVDWLRLECVVVGEAENGKEGMDRIKELEPDIVLLDINMPMMNGLELLEATADDYLFSTIIISGYDDFAYAKKAIKYGVEMYLLKPVDHHKLNEAIEKAKQSIKVKKRYQLIKSQLLEADEVVVLDLNLWNEHKHISSPMMTVIQFIEENYNGKITMNDLVDETGMSATYLNNSMKEMTSYTLNEFLNRYRVQKAIEIIKESDEKISTIALDVGFSSYRYFVKVFKRYTNSLPSDFNVQ